MSNLPKKTVFERCPEVLNFNLEKQKLQFANDMFPPCMHSLTEHRAKYVMPAKKPKIVTRESRLEQFWWNEFYQEYLRAIERSIKPHPMPNTEYTDNYKKDVQSSSSEELIDKYPLYASNSISFYNQDGDKNCNFRRNYSITKPVYLQDEQFG